MAFRNHKKMFKHMLNVLNNVIEFINLGLKNIFQG